MSKLRQVLVFLSCFCLLNIYRYPDAINDYNTIAWTNMLEGLIAGGRRRNKSDTAATGLLLRGVSSSSSSSSSSSLSTAEKATAGGNSHIIVSSAAAEEEEEEVTATTSDTDLPPPPPPPPPVVNVNVDVDDPCRKELTTDERIWIGMPAWNDKGLLHRAIRSVEAQADTAGYGQIKVVVFEDYSEHNMFTKRDKGQHGNTAGVHITYLREKEEPKQRGSAFGKDRLFSYIGSHALPHEYVLFLDGDDTLPDSTTLQYIHEELMLHKPWFAWGRHNGKYSEQCGDMATAAAWNDVRHAVWSFCHPRMFQSHLLSHLRVSDLQRQDGSWLQKATDRGFIYKFLELAGPTRSRYMGERRALYNYTFTSNNGLKVFSAEVITGDKQYMIDSKPSTRGTDHVHVVACVSNNTRQKNTAAFLSALFRSKVPPSSAPHHPVQFHFHICNNNQNRQERIQVLAESLAAKFADKAANQSQPHHTITVHNMAYNIGGLARFMIVQTLMSQVHVDYVIMLDDDQYVFKTTLAEIYEQREPKTYKAWHVKSWTDLDSSSGGGTTGSSRRRAAASRAGGQHDTAATKKNNKKRDFWEPLVERNSSTANPAANGKKGGHLEQQPEVKTWQYGAAGMSIIDANIFRIQQLFQDTDSYMFAEDIWLSYIVQRAGWKIQRLHVSFQQQQQQQQPNHHDDDHPSSRRRMKHVKNRVFEKAGYLGCSTPVP